MEAAAHGSSTLGIPENVGKEFAEADKGKTFDAEPIKALLREKGMGEDDIAKVCDMMPKPATDESPEAKAKREEDEKKTAETFRTINGVRYAIPGDYATVEADGTVTMLGRGSVSINTGGEKVYPEEVEAALKGHPDVFDALVVGVPDDRYGQHVAAVVAPRKGTHPTLAALDAFVRKEIAGYKVPRSLWLVDEVKRSPAGKPDYKWAKEQTEARPADDVNAKHAGGK
jgi:acyl-CoA synthetase (AMP-forming)/AMP-acid ligase II